MNASHHYIHHTVTAYTHKTNKLDVRRTLITTSSIIGCIIQGRERLLLAGREIVH